VCPRGFALNPALDISQYAHTAWTIGDGFFDSAVQAIAQTPDGYLWLGTQFGLFRFDGVRKVAWNPPAGERLPGANVTKLLVTRDGRLWIATRAGLASWKDGRLLRYPEFAEQIIGALAEDDDGTVWVGTIGSPDGRLCAMRSGVVRYCEQNGSFGVGIFSLLEENGKLWASAASGLWRWKPDPPKRYPNPDPGRELNDSIRAGDGRLLIATSGGLRELAGEKIEASPIGAGARPPRAQRLLRDRQGSLWISTLDRGLLHVHQGRTDQFKRSDGLSGDLVYELFEDREGSIWAATTEGLDRFRDFAIPTMSSKQGLISDVVGAVLAARDGSVWLGGLGGLGRWNHGQITIYRKRDGLPDDSIHALLEDSRGRIWVSTSRGLARSENGRFVAVPPITTPTADDIAEGRDGSLWIMEVQQGLIHLRGTEVVERIPWLALGHSDHAICLNRDAKRGGIWLGFFRGGIAFFKDGQIREKYGTAEGLAPGLVRAVYPRADGSVWAASESGLSRIKDGHVATLNSRNGLPCDSVRSAIEDDERAVWLYLACGMARISRSEFEAWAADPHRPVKSTIFDASDGVTKQGLGGYSPKAARLKDGQLWFATNRGVSIVDPRHLPVNNIPPPIHIESIKVDGKPYDIKRGMRLPANVHDVWIDYTALSFVAPEKVRFKYKLEGQDRDWKEVVNDREAQYTNLGPHHYRFRVIACNNSGLWNEAGDTLEFSIAPAWNQTTWFYASCVAAFLAMLWGLYRLRLYQISREFNAQLDGRVDERLRVARDLHDTLLQTFQASLIQMQAAYNMFTRRPEKAIETLQRAITTSAGAIAEGREAIQNMRSSTVLTNDLAQALRAAGDQMAVRGSARFEVRVQGSSRDVHPILRDEVYRIALEALRNAFQHAEAHAIEAEILYGDSLRVRIRDDGKGIDPAILKEGRRSGHYGLPGMRERADRIGGKLDVWTGPGAGTEIQLGIPGSIAFGTSGAGALMGLFRRKGKTEPAA